MPRAAREDLISAAERRALLNGEKETIVRVGDLMYVEPALTGKIELVYEGEQEGAQNVARMLIGRATRTVFVTSSPIPRTNAADASATTRSWPGLHQVGRSG